MTLPPLPEGFELEGAPGGLPPLPDGFELESDHAVPEKTRLGTVMGGIKAGLAGAAGTVAEIIDPTPMFGMDKVYNPIRPDLEASKAASRRHVNEGRAQYRDGFAGQAAGTLTELATNPLNWVGGAGKAAVAGAEKVAAGVTKRLVGSAATGASSGYVQGVGEGDNRMANTAIGAVAAPVVTGAGQAAISAGGAAKDIVKGAFGKSAQQWQEVAGAMKAKSQATYTAMRDAGAVISKKSVNSIVDDLEAAVTKSGKTNADLHKNTLSVLNDLKALKNKPLSMEEADQYRQLLNDVVSSGTDGTGKVNPDAMKALSVIDALDARIERLGLGDIASGATAAAPLLKQARQEWGQFRRFDKVASIIEKYGDSPGVMKNQIRLLLLNKKASRGFSDAELTALRKLSQKGGIEGWLRLAGRAGFDFKNPGGNLGGLALGPIVGAAAADASTGGLITAGATAARYASQALAKGQTDAALGTLSGLVRPAPAIRPFTAPRSTGAVASSMLNR